MKSKFLYIVFFLVVISVIIGFFILNKKQTVVVIGAMDVEIAEVLANLSDINYKKQKDFEIYTGKLGKYKIILTKSGVGKVSSSTTTQFVIDKYKPSYIINIGIAGSTSSSFKAGDTIIAAKMVQHDFDVTAFGTPKGYMDNGIEPDKPTIYYSDKVLVDKFSKDKNLKTGTVATGDIIIKKEFNADAVDMESAAIAQTAKRNNIPVIVLRTISDGQNGTTAEYKQNKETLARKPALIVVESLKSDN